MSNVRIYDNFLDQKSFYDLKNTLLSNDFPWYYLNTINYTETNGLVKDNKNNFQFTHIFYRTYDICSHYISLVDPLIKKINPAAILRIKANLLTITENIIESGFHIDYESNMAKTSIFYVNSNNGKTIFETGEEIQSIENRLVTFDCNLKHTGTSCTDEKVRCVINLNYYKED